MKIRIIDLMDYYHDDSVKLASPEALEQRRAAKPAQQTSTSAPHRGKRPLLVAAVLLLVLTAAVAAPLTLTRTPQNGAMTEGASPEVTPELEIFGASALENQEQDPAVFQSPSALEEEGVPAETVSEASSPYAPIMVDGQSISWIAEGNLLYTGDSYYTMTEAGPEPVEMQWVETTVELYGTWNVHFGYVPVDGELAIHTKNLGIDEGCAEARRIPGSTDSVLLTISRSDINQGQNCSYPFIYNFVTGEISDPLANVPNLFSHGDVMYVQFNGSLTRALVNVLNSDGEIYACDLTTGSMTDLKELVLPLIPEPEGDWEKAFLSGTCMWADNDTVLGTAGRGVPTEVLNQRLDQGWEFDEAREAWHCLWAYDLSAGTLKYQKEDVAIEGGAVLDFNQSIAYTTLYNSEYPDSTLLVVNPETGDCGILEGPTFEDSWADTVTEKGTRHVMKADDGSLYLADCALMQWANLSDILEDLPEDIAQAQFITEDWLCVNGGSGICCYHLPDDLPMNPLTAK